MNFRTNIHPCVVVVLLLLLNMLLLLSLLIVVLLQHSISYTLNRNQAVIVEYQEDNSSDMFQANINRRRPSLELIYGGRAILQQKRQPRLRLILMKIRQFSQIKMFNRNKTYY